MSIRTGLRYGLLAVTIGAACAFSGAACAQAATWVNDRGETVRLRQHSDGSVTASADGGTERHYGRDNQNFYNDFRLDRPGARIIERDTRGPRREPNSEPRAEPRAEPRCPAVREPRVRPERPERPEQATAPD